jgi:hypothetical protein
MGTAVAIGVSPACLHWSAPRAVAVGAGEDADVLVAIAPVAGLGRVVYAAPDLAIMLGYHVEAALTEIEPPT